MVKDNQPPPLPQPAAKKSPSVLVPVIIGIVVVLASLGIIWVARKRRAAATEKLAAASRAAQLPVPVVLGQAVQKDVPIYLEGLGTVQAFNTVTVRARVDGQLQKVAYVEGQDVRQGDLLARIDPAPYQAALEQAIGKKSQDQALLANSQLDLKREVDLYNAKIDSQQVYDTQVALVHQYEAAVKADQAAIDSAQVQLDYTTISSPIDGRTGIRIVDQGNIVHATDTNGLVVLTQLKPISVVFTLREQSLEEIHKQMAASSNELIVLAVTRDFAPLDTGKLAVIDNQINTSAGTITLKATFPNEKLQLWPGQFVNTRLLLTTQRDGIVVPNQSVQVGPTNGNYVFVVQGVGSNQTVKMQNVAVTQNKEGEALIASGLKAGDTVVVDGQYKLQEGSHIKVSPPGKTAASNSPAGGSPE